MNGSPGLGCAGARDSAEWLYVEAMPLESSCMVVIGYHNVSESYVDPNLTSECVYVPLSDRLVVHVAHAL